MKGIAQSGSNGGPLLLAVRSSANVEDLAGLSAAGLYESKVSDVMTMMHEFALPLLAVRSSANVVDLAGPSAVGLYESKVGGK